MLTALAAAFAVATARAVQPEFHWGAHAEVASGYLSSGGTLGDTRPVTTQDVVWRLDFGEYGSLSGYGWTVSSLHNKQHDRHRMLFNQFETTIYYGYDWQTTETTKLKSKLGLLWNPQVGYDEGHNCDWGVHCVESFENPYVTPYANGLWMVAPSPRSRIRFGIEHLFNLSETVTMKPFIETVWMDNRRFQSRYGGIPQDRFLGGAFATMTTGIGMTWRFAENWKMFARVRQFDVVNSQSRRAVRKKTNYYAKCDWPVAGVGLECNF